MTSRKSRATSVANKGKKALTNDSSRTAKPEQEGLLFPIEPKTHDILSDTKLQREEPLSARKPKPEQLLLPSHNEAKALCKLAAEIKALAPWQWMEETDVFGVEDPDTGEIGFVSVMGSIGEYEAVAVYPGAQGLYGFIDFQSDRLASPDRLIEIPQVQVSFSAPKFLEKRDRELLKGVGLKFTGARPIFRSYRPGFLPWFITLKEARLLIHALSETLQMAGRFNEEPAIFPGNGDGETEPFLVRVSRQEGTGLVWEDEIKRIPRPRPTLPPIEISIDADLLRDLKSIHLTAMQLEADLFIGPAGIGTLHERPLAVYMLMLADRHSGFILGLEALTAEDSLNAMYARVPETIARWLWQHKLLPKQIIVRSVLLLDVLDPLEKELKIQLRRANELPAIDEAVASMAQWLETGKM